jgi:hypothetical protein
MSACMGSLLRLDELMRRASPRVSLCCLPSLQRTISKHPGNRPNLCFLPYIQFLDCDCLDHHPQEQLTSNCTF